MNKLHIIAIHIDQNLSRNIYDDSQKTFYTKPIYESSKTDQ